MKFILVFVALLLAMTSVAAAAQSCAAMDHAAAGPMAELAPDARDCHSLPDGMGVGDDDISGIGAYCTLLCGVAPPAGPDGVVSANFTALQFFASADQSTGLWREPEAPPPRTVLL